MAPGGVRFPFDPQQHRDAKNLRIDPFADVEPCSLEQFGDGNRIT